MSQGLSSGGPATFLQSDMNINDPAVLRKRIAELENENKRLKEGDSSGSAIGGGNKVGLNTMRTGASGFSGQGQ